jgi:signal transduction histidine kinase
VWASLTIGIYQCGLVQERIAGDVLSLARIQLDMLSLYDVEMDLKKEARKILSVFASEGKSKRIDLDLRFGQSLEMARVAGIKTDPVRLGQVITNLISNGE